jgi:hypothetical protein
MMSFALPMKNDGSYDVRLSPYVLVFLKVIWALDLVSLLSEQNITFRSATRCTKFRNSVILILYSTISEEYKIYLYSFSIAKTACLA